MPQAIKDYQDKPSHDLLVELVAQGNSVVEKLTAMEKHLAEQNGKVSKSCDRLTKLETVNKVVYGILAAIGGIIAKLFLGGDA